MANGLSFFFYSFFPFLSHFLFSFLSKDFALHFFTSLLLDSPFIFLCFFVVRCICFLVIYAADITSDIMIFVVLIICEVVPCTILWLEILNASLSNEVSLTGSSQGELSSPSVAQLGPSQSRRSVIHSPMVTSVDRFTSPPPPHS